MKNQAERRRESRALHLNVSGRPDGGGGARVGAGEPLEEEIGRFIGRVPIKRHQGGWHAGGLHDICAPAVGIDRRDFDQVRAAADGLFESMNGCAHNKAAERLCCWGTRWILRFARRRSSEARHETIGDCRSAPGCACCERKKISVSDNQQEIHHSSTAFPQLDALRSATYS